MVVRRETYLIVIGQCILLWRVRRRELPDELVLRAGDRISTVVLDARSGGCSGGGGGDRCYGGGGRRGSTIAGGHLCQASLVAQLRRWRRRDDR